MLVLIVVLILVSITLAVRNQITQALEKEVGAYVAETIAEEQIAQANKGLRSPEGAIYVQYSTEFFMELGPPRDKVSSTPYLSVWTVEDAKIRPLGNQELTHAVKDVYFVAFSVRSLDKQEASVDVITSYPGGPGGNGEHWILSFDENKWNVIRRELFFNWD